MATALDLLMSTKEDVNLLSEESDICTIDAKTRVIFVPSTIVVGGVQSDKNAERIKFSCPKIVGDNLDLSKFSVRINFENVSSVDFNVSIKDQYICDDVAVDGENVTFSWLIGRNAARYMGTVRFIVCAVKTDSDSNISIEWNTTIAEVPVLEGIEIDQPQIGQEEKDVINQLLELTKNTSAEAVQNVNSAKEQAIKDIQSVSQPDTTLTIEGGLAEAKATGEAIGSLKEDIATFTGLKNANGEELWERKGIWNGDKGNSSQRITTINYIAEDVECVVALNGYVFNLWGYDEHNTSVGCWNGNSFVNGNQNITSADLVSIRKMYPSYHFYLVLWINNDIEITTSAYVNAIFVKGVPKWVQYLDNSVELFKSSTDFLFSSTYKTILSDANNATKGYYYCYFNTSEIADGKCTKNLPVYGMTLSGCLFSFLNTQLKGGCYQFFLNSSDNTLWFRYNNGSTWLEWKRLNNCKNIVEVSITGEKMFSSIGKAVNYASSFATKSNPVTIKIYPGVYNETVSIQNKNISLIGTNKKDCIIMNDKGGYDDAPIFASGNFYISNLTIKATHDGTPNFVENRRDDYTIGAYGVHVDNADYSDETEKKGIIENCIIYSAQNQAVGIGMAKNCKYIIRNCELINDTPDRMYELYSRPLKTGALGCHRGYFDGSNYYQILEVSNCILKVNKGVSIQLGPFTKEGTGMEEHFYNNMLWSGTLGKSDSAIGTYQEKPYTSYELSEDCYGNNVSALNN
jgi:hypothetical protein